jgi:hypothetical protein
VSNRFLFTFRHGLGDIVQFTIVLKHLQHYRPDSFVAVAAPAGKIEVMHGIADETFALTIPKLWKNERWDLEYDVRWSCSNFNHQIGISNSKVTESLICEFGLPPVDELYRYIMVEQDEAREKAEEWVAQFHGSPFCLLHVHSEVNPAPKGLSPTETDLLCSRLIEQGFIPVLLDLGSHEKRRRADVVYVDEWAGIMSKHGNPSVVLSLCRLAARCIMIDSGPAHIAAATATPTQVIWRGTSPCYCFDPHPNCVHIVPVNWRERLHPMWRDGTAATWLQHNESVEYDDLREWIESA